MWGGGGVGGVGNTDGLLYFFNISTIAFTIFVFGIFSFNILLNNMYNYKVVCV